MSNHASPLASAPTRALARPAPSSHPARSARPVADGPSRGQAGLLTGPAAILAAAVLWGTTGTASTLAPAGARPAAIGSAGLAAGGLLLFLTSRGARSLPAACTRAQRWLLGLGALAVAGYPVTFYPAVARTGVAVATVIALGSAPVFAGLLAWATGQGRPGARWAATTAAAVLGCGALVLAPGLTGHGAPADFTGVMLAGLAGLCYAGYSLIGRTLIAAGHSAAPVLGAMFGAAGLAALPVLLAIGTGWLGTWRPLPRSWPTGSSDAAWAARPRRWPPRSPWPSPPSPRCWVWPSSASGYPRCPGAGWACSPRGWPASPSPRAAGQGPGQHGDAV